MKKKLLALAIVLAVIAAMIVPMAVSADTGTNTYYISPTGNDTSGNGSSALPWATIGHAVSQATSGQDTIDVEAGTYTEPLTQVVIANNLTIVGAGAATTVIKPSHATASDNPSSDANAWFLVESGVTFNLSNVTLDGSGQLISQAIRDHGQGTISNCTIENIAYQASGEPYQGVGIYARGGNVNVSNCTLTGIGRIGVYYYGTGITGSTVNNNTYTGKGVGDWLDYGVEVEDGAMVTISNNTISGCVGVASVDGSTSAGILATTYFGGGTKITVTGNNIFGNYDGVAIGYMPPDTTTAIVNNNNLAGNTFGVDNYGAPQVNAELNWWGTADSTVIATLVNGSVDYSDYLSSAAALIGTIGSGGSDGVVVSGTMVAPNASITAPSAIGFGPFKPGWNFAGPSTTDGSVTVSGSAGTVPWTVTASGYGWMTSGLNQLANPLLIGSSGISGPWCIANGGGATIDSTSYPTASPATLTYTGTTSVTNLSFAAAQYIAASDASDPAGNYSDIITFALSITP